MASLPSKLRRAEALHRLGVSFPFDVGTCVARGFADLGAEEFLLTGSGSIVSVFTGESSTLPPDYEKHFFRIPSVDELIDELDRRQIVVKQLTFIEQREWQGTFSGVEWAQSLSDLRFRSMEELLMEVLIQSIEKSSTTSEERRVSKLRVEHG